MQKDKVVPKGKYVKKKRAPLKETSMARVNKKPTVAKLSEKMKKKRSKQSLKAKITTTKALTKKPKKRKVSLKAIPKWDIKSQLEVAKRRIDKLTASKKQLQEENDQLSKQLEEVRANYLEESEQKKKIVFRQQELESQYNVEKEKLDNQISVKNEQYLLLRSNYDLIEVSSKDTQKNLDEVRNEFSVLKDEKNDLKMKNEHLQKEVYKISKDLADERQERNTESNEFRSVIEKQRIKAVGEIDSLKKDHEKEIKRIKDNYKDQIKDLRMELENQRLKSNSQIDKLKLLHEKETNKIKNEKEGEINGLKNTLNEEKFKMKEEINNLKREFTDEKEKICSLKEKEMTSVKDECKSMILDIKNQKLQEISQKNLQIEKIRNEHNTNVTILKEKYENEKKILNMNLQEKENLLKQDYMKNRDDLQTKISQMRNDVKCLENTVDKKVGEISMKDKEIFQYKSTIMELERKRHIDEEIRRGLHNKIMELKGNIRVFCRVRPILQNERSIQQNVNHIKFPDNSDHKGIKLIANTTNYMGEKNKETFFNFEFDRTFGPSSNQEEIFNEISQLVQSALDGYKVCIFAYGQTGSGKTHTMEGSNDLLNVGQRGMIPRSVEKIFKTAQFMGTKGWIFKIRVGFVEIYNEKLRDLLTKKKVEKPLEIKHFNDGNTTINNLSYIPVVKPDQVLELLETAHKNRATASTNCNARSSRSHSVFTLDIIGENAATQTTTKGTLNLVDLAGSERLSVSQSTGDRLTEAKYINKSLSALGNVMSALEQKSTSKKKVHIPYRDSKLTYLLQNSLGGHSKTLMFCNVSPLESCFNESINSLRFASKVNSFEIGVAKKQFIRK